MSEIPTSLKTAISTSPFSFTYPQPTRQPWHQDRGQKQTDLHGLAGKPGEGLLEVARL